MSDPLFPFGFGLSYTTFSIGDARLFKNVLRIGESTGLTIPVSNKGNITGTEIVQVYIRKANDLNGPLKTLRNFCRVSLAPGKTSEITIDLPQSAFEFFDRTSGKMTITPGDYELWYGNCSDNKALKMVKITVI
jgi:beta-glucosidase